MKARLQPSGCQLDLGAVYGSAEGHERESYTIRAFFPPSPSLSRGSPGLMQGPSHAWGVGGCGGKWKDKFRGKKKDIVAVTEDDGWRQSQIQAKRKVKISEENEI